MKTRVIQGEPSDRSPAEGGDPARGTRTTAGPDRAVDPPVRGWVPRHALVTFFVLSFAIGWCMVPFGTFLPFGPLIAALVVVALCDGVSGLKHLGSRLIRWRVGWVWYAVAILAPLGVHALAIAGNMAAGAPAPSMSQFTPWYSVLMLIGLRMVNPLDGPLGEEPGWRGVAQPGLQARRSPLAATTILGVLIAIWHLPLVLMPSFDLAPVGLLTTFVVTFWYAWLFNRTGGSVLLTLLAHDVEGSIDTSSWWPAGPFADRHEWFWLGAWAVLVAALLLFDRTSWTRAPLSAVDEIPGRPAVAEPVPAP